MRYIVTVPESSYLAVFPTRRAALDHAKLLSGREDVEILRQERPNARGAARETVIARFSKGKRIA